MDQILRNLQDVPGVIGSFVFDTDGTLVGKHMPPVVSDHAVPDHAVPDLGRRLAAVFAALDNGVSCYDDLLLKFESHWISCRRTGRGLLSVLCTKEVNYPALRMAAGVAALKLDADAASPAPAPPLLRKPAGAPQATPAPKRYWRGQPVD